MKLDNNEYTIMMTEFFNGIGYVQMKEVSQISDLASNLITWSSYRLSEPLGYGKVTFYLAGDASYIFNTRYHIAKVATVDGYCSALASTSYESSSSVITIQFSHNDFSADPICRAALTPELFGYNARLDGDNFAINVDVRSLMTALSINFGLNDLAQLEKVQDTTLSGLSFIYRDVYYQINYWVISICISINLFYNTLNNSLKYIIMNAVINKCNGEKYDVKYTVNALSLPL
jgi:hypothetical protein